MGNNINNKPLVSIVIPCYNQGQYVLETIDSALAQNYENIEIILINDGSTDQLTNNFFKSYSNPEVKTIITQNNGLAKARNLGFEESKGDFIIPLDSDDKLAPEFVSKTLAIALKDKKVGVVYTDQMHFGAETKVLKMMEFDPIEILSVNHVSVCSLIRREAYEAARKSNGVGYNPNMKFGYEDWDLWINISKNNWEFRCVHEPLFLYRRHKISMASTAKGKHNFLIDTLVNNHKELYVKYAPEVVSSLQTKLNEKEMYIKDINKDISNKKWLLKRLFKLILGHKPY